MTTFSNARPTFFLGAVYESQTSRAGYWGAGFTLARHVRDLIEGEVDDDVFDALEAILDLTDEDERDGALWGWLRQTLPRCMALVPTRRRTTFMRGVAEAIDEGLLQ
jgi:hypothetical protein